MKTCPTCNKQYDDTWKVCLTCSVTLVDSGVADIGVEVREKKPFGYKVLGWLFVISFLFTFLGFVFMVFGRGGAGGWEEQIESMRVEMMKGVDADDEEAVARVDEIVNGSMNIFEMNRKIQSDLSSRIGKILGVMGSFIFFLLGIGLIRSREVARKRTIFFMWFFIFTGVIVSLRQAFVTMGLMKELDSPVHALGSLAIPMVIFSFLLQFLIVFFITSYLKKDIVRKQFT